MPSTILPTQTGDKQFDEVTALMHSMMDALEGVTAERDRLRAENARLMAENEQLREALMPPPRAALKETGNG